MNVAVCLFANTLWYPRSGGHRWVYLNWALGLRALGCEIIWLEGVRPGLRPDRVRSNLAALKSHLEPYGLADRVALCAWTGEPLPGELKEGCQSLEAAVEADLLLNVSYGLSAKLVQRFRRSALLDIDPGLLQSWVSAGDIVLAPHDVYFTTGETVGQPNTRIPDVGLDWHYTPPCVSLDGWPVRDAAPDAPFSTVSHWSEDAWMTDGGEGYRNDKRAGFLPFLELPRHTGQRLELALCLAPDEEEDREALQQNGWRIRDSDAVSSTPWDYQNYIQASLGEFSCVKPSCIRFQNAWISDRTLCYLASGKPAVVQHTGCSRFLPDRAGLFRFRDLDEAARCLETVAADYPRQCRLARALAEEYFDAPKVARRVLERALGI